MTKKEIGIIDGKATVKCKDGRTRNLVFGESEAKLVKGVWIPQGGGIASFKKSTFDKMKVGDKIQWK